MTDSVQRNISESISKELWNYQIKPCPSLPVFAALGNRPAVCDFPCRKRRVRYTTDACGHRTQPQSSGPIHRVRLNRCEFSSLEFFRVQASPSTLSRTMEPFHWFCVRSCFLHHDIFISTQYSMCFPAECTVSTCTRTIEKPGNSRPLFGFGMYGTHARSRESYL